MGRNHEQKYERKDENYTPLGINAMGIISLWYPNESYALPEASFAY